MRLIDADELKKQIAGMTIKNHYSVKRANALCKLLDEQPTAFDVDKVVTQIKDIKDKEYAACTDQKCGYCKYLSTCSCGDKADKLALDRAIEIVKGGGVE